MWFFCTHPPITSFLYLSPEGLYRTKNSWRASLFPFGVCGLWIFFFNFIFFPLPTPSLIKIASKSIVGMLEVPVVLLMGVRDIGCLCSCETWDSRRVTTTQQVSWDGHFKLEMEDDGCHDVMSEVTWTTWCFSLAGSASTVARNSLWGNVRKFRDPCHESQMSVMSQRASQLPAPNLVVVPAAAPGWFFVDGGTWSWQDKS